MYKERESEKDVLLMRSKYLKQKAYWMKKLSGDFDATDFSDIFEDSKNKRKPPTRVENKRIDIAFHDELIKRMIGLSKGSDLSIYILLLSALKSLIFRYTFKEDIVILSPVNTLKLKEETINSQLFIRNHVHGDLTFKELILEVRQSVLDAYENQDYPYDKLLEHLFPAPGEQEKKMISNIRCSSGNLHSDKEIKKINARLSFHFLREGDRLSGFLLFEVGTCEESDVLRFSNHLVQFLGNALENVNAKISHILFLTGEEKKRLLVDFNDNRADFSRDRTIFHFIEDNAERRPDSPAIVFLDDEITYRDLNREANRLAKRLQEYGVGEDRTVGILLERSPRMVKSILAAWKAGGAYIPLHSNFPNQRIREVLSDSHTGVLITESKHVDPDLEASYKGKIIKLDVDKQTGAWEDRDPGLHLEIDMNALSYVIYTSGSTGTPKGVMVEHIGMMNHIGAKIDDLHLSEESIVAQNASHTFDISVWQFFAALIPGGKTVIYPDDVVFDPNRFISRLIEHRVTILEVVPSYLSVMLEFLDSDFKPLNFLDFLLVTGEIVKPGVVKKWFDKYPGIKMVNAYGPTEASDDITHFIMDRAVDRDRVPIGKTIRNFTIYIVDKYMNICPIGVKGEIWVSGIGVGRGYLNSPERTAEAFTEDSFVSPISTHPPSRAAIYKTGDLGRWLPDGTIEFYGRKDYQVKIRGFRIELGEIESQLSAHPKVKEAAAILKESEDKYLCAYLVTGTEGEPDIPGLKEYLGERLPYYMVPDHFVQLKQMPLTPNGKIDRNALSRLDDGISPGAEYVMPRNRVEEKLAEIWAQVLEIEKETIGIDSNFFQLGGHSLRATLVISKIRKVFNVKLSLQDLFRYPTIRGTYGIIIESEENKFISIVPAEKKEYYPLTSMQKGLYIIQQMDRESTVYNMSMVIPFDEHIEPKKLEDAFKKLFDRHESLKTSFEMLENQPVQKIHSHMELKIQHHEAGGMGEPSTPGDPSLSSSSRQSTSVSRIVNDFIRPFDLSQAPLLRVGLVTVNMNRQQQHLLMVDMHHIISDGISLEILSKEFLVFYNGEALSSLKIQYRDYAEWQTGETQGKAIRAQGAYWFSEFTGEIPLLDLPIDYARPLMQSFEGKRIRFEISQKETDALNRFSLEAGVTLYMTLVAIFNVLMHKVSGQEDIIIGIPVAGRNHSDLETIIGMFVNTLALRNYPKGAFTFRQFLKDAAEKTLNAFENQNYPFNELVEKVLGKANREPGRNPLFDVMLDLQNMGEPIASGSEPENESEYKYEEDENAPEKRESHLYESQVSRFDMTWDGEARGNRLLFSIEYCTKLFKQETILTFTRYFKKIITTILESPDLRIEEVEIISEEEKKQVLIECNRTGTPGSPGANTTISRLFEAESVKTPGKIAVEIEDKQLTYHELNQGANRLANGLREKGVDANTIVAVLVKRSLEMIIGVTAVHKAGGAYLPLDLSYPRERLEYMLEDSGTAFLLTQDDLEIQVAFTGEIIHIETPPPGKETIGSPEAINKPGDLAYLIYTSGSTGRPRGVMVQNDHYVNASSGWTAAYGLAEIEVNLLQMAAFSFDVFAGDLARALANGGRLVICPEEVRPDPPSLYRLIRSRRISLFEATPSLILPLMEYVEKNRLKIDNLVLLILGSDTCPGEAFERLVSRFGNQMRIINSYGVTEATIDTSFYEAFIESIPSSVNVPIGKPLPNIKCYVMAPGDQLHLQPIGIPGELYIGGKGVSRGYINGSERTLECFLPNPFIPGERIYKTGDLARWLPGDGGNIEFLGRIDNQVKIRGFRIELGEIESLLLKHPQVKEAVVIDIERDGGEKSANGNGTGDSDRFLCAYIVSFNDRSSFSPGLREFLSRHLPYYMIPTYFVRMETIPLTPNGKVDRKALPSPGIKSDERIVPPRNRLEEKLVEIWADVLAVETDTIGIHSNFFQLGGHSLKAAVLVSRVHKELDVKLPMAEVFRAPTINELSETIEGLTEEPFESIVPAEKKEYYVLSSVQKRLYIVQHMDMDNIAYSMPYIVTLGGDIDKGRLEETFGKLIHRHESLRTSFEMIDDEPVQKVDAPGDVTVEIELYEMGAQGNNGASLVSANPGGDPITTDIDTITRDFIRPFDLSQAPLLRVGLIKRDDRHCILMVDMHHIISDGASEEILVKEFTATYADEALPPLPLQFKDYAEWQNSHQVRMAIKKQEAYWLKEFEGEIPELNMPIDFDRPPVQSFEGSSLSFGIGKKETERLRALAVQEDATLYMVMFAIYNVLLSKLSGQEEIIVGIVIAGRQHADLQDIIGMFVNTLAVRNFPGKEKTFRTFLREVKTRVLCAYENQDYQFENLVEKVVLENNRSRNPLFDTVFNSGNTEIEPGDSQQGELPELSAEGYGYENRATKFDIAFFCNEGGEELFFTMDYCTKLFKKETLERFTGYFKEIISHVIENSDTRLKDITISHHLLHAASTNPTMELGF